MSKKNEVPIDSKEGQEAIKKIIEKKGIVIGTKDEVFWTRVKQETEAVIEAGENNLKLQRELLIIAKHKILLEKRK